jgi:hypothetical protein
MWAPTSIESFGMGREAEEESQEITRALGEAVSKAEGALRKETELKVQTDQVVQAISHENADMHRRDGSGYKRKEPASH